MADPSASRSNKLYLLWLLGAVLAFAAVGVEYYKLATINWMSAGLGAFCAVMGMFSYGRAHRKS